MKNKSNVFKGSAIRTDQDRSSVSAGPDSDGWKKSKMLLLE